MKASLRVAGLAGAVVGALAAPERVEERAGCAADNCLRAVSITRLGQATQHARLIDCKSFLRVTVTPATTTALTTVTVTTSITPGAASSANTNPSAKRRDVEEAQVAPRAATTTTGKPIPAYASPCSGKSASSSYSSACLCAGATIPTDTAPTPTLSSTVYVTSTVTIADSPPFTPSAPVHVPEFYDWTSTYTYYEATLPTFAPAVEPTFSSPIPVPTPCFFDPTVSNNEFYLMDQTIGYMVNRNGVPGPPVAPTTQAEADAHSDPSTFNPPTYYFEKPASGPAGLYDIVLAGSNPKQYIAMGTNGDMQFTSGSTNGVVRNRLITTVFGVDCKGFLTVTQGKTSYTWVGTDSGSTATAGTPNNKGMVLLPKAMKNPIPARPSKRALEERTWAEDGLDPRCWGAPSNVISTVKPGARAPAANGCGAGATANFIPNWNFGDCCNNHDYCYDDCGRTWEGCNSDFLGCMYSKCWDVADSWTFWLAPACFGMADLYAGVVSSVVGAIAFQGANSDRCHCVCPNSSPNNYAQSLCGGSCIITGGNDNNNCGGCGNTCPFKTHCSNGGCTCDDNRCGNLCVNLQSHPRNCGSCGNACASGYCYQGTCTPIPANPTTCIPVDGFENGGFGYGNDQAWTVSYTGDATADQQALGVFDGASDGGDPYDAALGILHGPNGGSVTLSQMVHICPGVAYQLDFQGRRVYGTTRSCSIQATLGGRTVQGSENIAVTGANFQAFGPYNIQPFNAGDAGTAPAAQHYMTTEFRVTVTCNGGADTGADLFRFDSFSVYPQ